MMSRYQVTLLTATGLGALALAFGKPIVTGVIILVLLIVIALGTAFPRWQFYGPYICRGTASRPWVALTFDDGPDPQSTPALLELLAQARVPAAFFGVGARVAAHADLAARIVGGGHLLENHSYSHSSATNVFTEKRLRQELEKTQAAIREATGIVPKAFRPPMGLTNPRVFRVARAMGLAVVGWTARGFDTLSTDPERIVGRIKRQLKPGAIILLHDGGIPVERLLATVKTLLDTLQTLGYEVVRLDRMLT